GPPQEVLLPHDNQGFGAARGQVDDLFPDGSTKRAPLDPEQRWQTESLDDYTLSGPNWDWAWPRPHDTAELQLMLRDFMASYDLDLFKRTSSEIETEKPTKPYPQLLQAQAGGDPRTLQCGRPNDMRWTIEAAYANYVVDEDRITVRGLEQSTFNQLFEPFLGSTKKVASIPADADLLAVPGSIEDVLI